MASANSEASPAGPQSSPAETPTPPASGNSPAPQGSSSNTPLESPSASTDSASPESTPGTVFADANSGFVSLCLGLGQFGNARSRAENLTKLLHRKTKIGNLMRAVGMGGSDFFDKTDLQKNRVVEIWIVRP